MHILLTRPIEDCNEMILKFQSLGHKVSHLPLISIKSMKHESIKYSNFTIKKRYKKRLTITCKKYN